MLEERMSQADAFRGAFNQARNISHDKPGSVSQVHHAQMGIQGGKMVIGYLRLCVADNRQQRGFSHIRKAHQAHVRNDLKLQLHPQLGTGLPGLRVLGHLHGRCCKVHISKTAPAAP